METKREMFEDVADAYIGLLKATDGDLSEMLERYDAAPDDAPRLGPGEPVNGDMVEAALDWAKEQGRRESEQELEQANYDATKYKTLLNEAERRWQQDKARVEELEQQAASAIDYFSMEKTKELEHNLHKQQDAYHMQQGDVEHKQRRIEELERKLEARNENYNTILSENEQLRANHQGKLAQYIRQNEQLRKDLDAAKDARIQAGKRENQLREELDAARDARDKAEREANDVRAWRRGLVKPFTELPAEWPIVAETEYGVSWKYGMKFTSGICDIRRWFDPRDVFKAADREAEQESK